MSVDEPVLQALDELIEAIEENTRRNRRVLARARRIKQQRAKGKPWREIVSDEERPLIVELLTQNMKALATAGANVRRMEAQALHAEGLPMDRIAELFGVTRQRISELLRRARNDAGRDTLGDAASG